MLNIVCNSSACLIVSPVRISLVPGLEKFNTSPCPMCSSNRSAVCLISMKLVDNCHSLHDSSCQLISESFGLLSRQKGASRYFDK